MHKISKTGWFLIGTVIPLSLLALSYFGAFPLSFRSVFVLMIAALACGYGALVAAITGGGKKTVPAPAKPNDDQPRSADGPVILIQGITTSATRKHDSIPALTWGDSAAGATDIKVLPANTRQSILGFGAALTGSACAVLHRMPLTQRTRLMRELFSPIEMNLNVTRTSIGSSDYSPSLYSYCDSSVPDPELGKFSIAPDRADVLPTLKEALAINRGLYVFSSPWSPPGWMKPNGTMLGGAMDNRYLPAYAQYFVKFIKAYAAEGISIRAVTVQNEVQADQGGLMPACTWTTDLENEFVRDHLGPALADAHLNNVGIWMMDHNYDMEERAIKSLSDPGVRQFCNAIAWHGYGGDASAVSRVVAATQNSEHHFTEFNTFLDAPQYMTDWTYWGTQIGEAMRNHVKDYVMWNVALDEHGKPNIGPFTCGGVVTVNSQTHEVSRSGGYWGLGHYSRYVRRGAVCVESTGNVEKLTHVAFRNPDGAHVMVLSNAGAARSVNIECEINGKPNFATIAMEADSVTTIYWAPQVRR